MAEETPGARIRRRRVARVFGLSMEALFYGRGRRRSQPPENSIVTTSFLRSSTAGVQLLLMCRPGQVACRRSPSWRTYS
jgi:hypothetical protein